MVSDKEKANGLDNETFDKMARELSANVFNGGQVTLELTDNKFNPFKSFVAPTSQ